MADNEQNRWLIRFGAGVLILACVAFPPLLLLVIPGGICLYFYYEQKNAGRDE